MLNIKPLILYTCKCTSLHYRQKKMKCTVNEGKTVTIHHRLIIYLGTVLPGDNIYGPNIHLQLTNWLTTNVYMLVLFNTP